jgi:hypothetical protein
MEEHAESPCHEIALLFRQRAVPGTWGGDIRAARRERREERRRHEEGSDQREDIHRFAWVLDLGLWRQKGSPAEHRFGRDSSG